MIKNIIAIIVICLTGLSAFSQEVLTMPANNPAVAKQYQLNKANYKAASSETALTLPFYDDFSELSVYPSPLRWKDNLAFINSDLAIDSPSIGVATMDAIDETGSLYPDAGPNPFDADYLTSMPIRLDSIFFPTPKALSPADSVYLSFYYQPQGRTISPPSKNASLWLEFHAPGDDIMVVSGSDTTYEEVWNTKWFTIGGIKIDSFAGPDKQYFQHVVLPITDTAYFKNGFQFRFHNVATLSGNSQTDWRNNGSHWNIDVVYLQTYPSGINNSPMLDVAFGDQAPSALKNYESMPFYQYRQNFLNEIKENFDIKIANLGDALSNKIYTYEVRKNSIVTPIATPYNGGSGNIKPFLTNGYSDWSSFANPPVNFYYPPSADKNIVFHIIHALTPDNDPLFQNNDTIQYDQVFSNYYAYDNGTPEAGIGINGSAGSYAVQFKLNEPDTLRGIKIFFNPLVNGGNQEFIDLNVWNDKFGEPGQIVFSLQSVNPIYTSGLNEFASYWFESPLILDPGTFPGLIFYIGWTQTSVNNLNVGFDRYKDSHLKRFFNVIGKWEQSDSINYGSVMLRPVVGHENPLVIEKPAEAEKLSFHPNPVNDGNLLVKLPESWKNIPEERLNIQIVSATGAQVLNGTFSNPVNVKAISPGLYVVILTDNETGPKASGKVIIQ